MRTLNLRKLGIAAVLALSVGCSSSTANLAPIASTPLAPYLLGAGDEVRITVFGLDAVNNSYTISDTGEISLPLVGAVAAQGKTIHQLETVIGEALRTRDVVRSPSVSAQVQRYRPFFILGEVQKPGQYAYVPGMSVLTAVSIAGGYTFRAQTDRAIITRSGTQRIVQGMARPDTPILPGDTVLVKEAWF